jgi:hypothetical protein
MPASGAFAPSSSRKRRRRHQYRSKILSTAFGIGVRRSTLRARKGRRHVVGLAAPGTVRGQVCAHHDHGARAVESCDAFPVVVVPAG